MDVRSILTAKTLSRRKLISAVLNCHREQDLLKRSLVSTLASLHAFDPSGADWELLCIADRSDDDTLRILGEQINACKSPNTEIRMIRADLGDLGLSRNLAAENASGDYLGFVDADDLVSGNWFPAAYEYNKRNPQCILHPECSLYFGSMKAFMVHRNQRFYDLRALFFHNLWTALSFAPVDTYRRTPYMKNQIDQGFGYEDWHWNCETIRQGYEHRMVPETCHFIRLKEGSLSDESAGNRCLIRPTPLWKSLSRSQIESTSAMPAFPVPLTTNPAGDNWVARLRRALNRPSSRDALQKGLLGESLFRDPSDITFDMMPAWIHSQAATATTQESTLDLSGTLSNFSPILPNPFVQHFPNSLLEAVSTGIETLWFSGPDAALSHVRAGPQDLVLIEDCPSKEARHVSLAGLDRKMGDKFELSLAMLMVQSGCRNLRIYDSVTGLKVLSKHQRALTSSLSAIYYHSKQPLGPTEWDALLDAVKAVRVCT